jgi:quercetin dioxygenase-like cupin family protein
MADAPGERNGLAAHTVVSHTVGLTRPLRALCSATLIISATRAFAQAGATSPPTYRSPGGATLRLLLDESNVGPEVTVGEITFPPNADSGEHTHGSIEMFYVLSGTLEHVVNGKSYFLKPGMTGYVRPADTIRHKTGPDGAKAVVIWTPGDEAKKIVARWKKEP